ncbi:hypothetical protein [Geminocystis sp. NIES-3709]|uniref:hypothetical protein n=1 Tax=Geminocystis sp. NIES-3709 TaxID=1617448 RepID=UPI0005FCC8FC|nr:hypothetical protein [Geminocystis sp. NIES-3709]BAQ63239.1 hypothetical protein GM3709_4 [Geminocystis sp. NIES-3709]
MTIDSDVILELNHELIKPLQDLDDLKLWQLWQKSPHQARYLIVLFYRYAYLTDMINNDLNNIETQQQYFERLWFFLFDRLSTYNIQENSLLSEVITQLINQFFNEEKVIVTQTYQNDYNLQIRYLPLKYYLQKNLDKLPYLERIILVTKDKFTWEDEKILQYLRQQKQEVTLAEIKAYYTQAHSRLLNLLPIDIISIYL